MKPGICRVLIVDDHEMLRRGLADILDSHPETEVVGQAASCTEAMQGLAGFDPDVALVDLSLPDGSGVELIGRIKATAPLCKCIVLSAHDPETFAVWALRSGADAYLDKATTAAELCATVLAIWRSRKFSGTHRARREAESEGPHKRGTGALSDREFEVFLLVGQGHTTKEIAASLGLSAKTIDNHKKAIREKLGLADHDKLLRFAALAARPGTAPTAGVGDEGVIADRELVADFEARGIPVEAWTHRAHVRVAFYTLRNHDFEKALDRIRHGIRRLNATHGWIASGPAAGTIDPAKANAYHETITRAYAMVILHRILTARLARDSAAFLAAHPDLVAPDALAPLLVHYTRERLLSPAARAAFVPPDRAPLPAVDP